MEVQECEKKLVKPEESWKAPTAHARIVKDSRNSVIKISYITVIMLKLVLHAVNWIVFVFTQYLEDMAKDIVYIYNQSSDSVQKGMEDCYLI